MLNHNYNAYIDECQFSFVHKFMNYTASPIFILDGGGTNADKIQTLQPIIRMDGVGPNINREYLGGIIIERSKLMIDGRDNWEPVTYEKIATPPLPSEAGFSDWIIDVPNYNVVLSTNIELLASFAEKYKSSHAYKMETDFGTRFVNSANFGIINCTGKTLYEVDDSGAQATGRATMYELPSGEDIPLPLWLQQQANNAYNVRPNSRYIRAYRYCMMHTKVGEFRGHMKEWIYYWDKEIVINGFLYIGPHNVALFEDRKSAQEFLDRFSTVEGYRKTKIVEEVNETIDKKIKTEEDRINRKNKRVIIACGIFTSLQVVTKGFEILWYLTKKRAEENQPVQGPATATAAKASFQFYNTRL